VISLTIPAQTSGLPTITDNGSGGGSVIRFNGDNITVSGFNIIQNDFTAIFDNFFLATFSYLPVSNITIINNVLTQNTDRDVVFLRSISGNNIISNNAFGTNGNATHGVTIDQENLTIGNLTINRNTFTQFNNDEGAIFIQTNINDFEGAELTVIIENNIINDSISGNGMTISSYGNSLINAIIKNNTINNNDDNGISLFSLNQSTFNAIVSNNTCTNNGGWGIKFDPHDNSTMNGIFTQNNISANGDVGIGFNFTFAQSMSDVSVTATIDGNTCNQNQGLGMYFAANEFNVADMHFTISNNSLIGNGDGFIGDGYTLFFGKFFFFKNLFEAHQQ
jgi:hypothetical protein